MSRFLSKLLPKRLTGQLMLLVLFALIVAQLVNLIMLVDTNRLRARDSIVLKATETLIEQVQRSPGAERYRRGRPPPPRRSQGGAEFLRSPDSQAKLLQPSSDLTSYRKKVETQLADAQIQFLSFDLVIGLGKDLKRPPKYGHDKGPPPDFRGGGERRPPPPRTIDPDPHAEVLILSVQVEQGRWANVLFPHQSIEALTPRIMLATAALLLITLLSVGFFVRKLVKPLSELTDAAESFGRGMTPDELCESGPQDIRNAAHAFNQMQRRLSRTLETQRTMLRAVGHDLRTPLTSLRIRSELITDDEIRAKFINTIEDMTALTEEILAWAKNLSGLEEPSSVDLSALISSVVDDYADQGHHVQLEQIPVVMASLRRRAFKRALQNVIGNAIKYGGACEVSIRQSTSNLDVIVADKGPGIPEQQLTSVLQPFVRLETSRNRDSGGTGLGLSITEAILNLEGGKLLLQNRKPRGLKVVMRLPRLSSDQV